MPKLCSHMMAGYCSDCAIERFKNEIKLREETIAKAHLKIAQLKIKLLSRMIMCDACGTEAARHEYRNNAATSYSCGHSKCDHAVTSSLRVKFPNKEIDGRTLTEQVTTLELLNEEFHSTTMDKLKVLRSCIDEIEKRLPSEGEWTPTLDIIGIKDKIGWAKWMLEAFLLLEKEDGHESVKGTK